MSDKTVRILLIIIPAFFVGLFFFDNFEKLFLKKTIAAEPVIVITDTVVGREYHVARLVAIYTAEIGVREHTGKNDGRRVEEYLSSCNLGKGYAWCAAFVNWCHVQADIIGANSAWSPSWFPKRTTIYTHGEQNNTTPSQADVFGQWFNDKKRIAHVGFIDDWGEGDYCITVEGNTNDGGSREGDGVYRKRRLKNQIYKVSRWI